MKSTFFKAVKYMVIVWTLALTIGFILVAIFCEQVSDRWMDFYFTQHKNLTSERPMMKLVNNSQNKTFYEYDPNGQGYDAVILKSAHKKATIVVILISSITGAIFHLIGLIGSVKSVHCLVLMFAIYLTFTSVMLFINSFTIYWEFIPTLFYSIITGLSYCLCHGIREERVRVLDVGAIDANNISQSSIDSMFENKAENYYKLYPDLSNQIFCVESQQFNDKNCAQNTQPVPSAPPLPASQYMDFSTF